MASRIGLRDEAAESAVLVTHPTPVDRPRMVQVLGYSDLGRSFTSTGIAVPGTVATDTWETAIGLVESSPQLCAVAPSAMVRAAAATGSISIAPVPAVAMDEVYWFRTGEHSTTRRQAVFDFLTWLRDQHERSG